MFSILKQLLPQNQKTLKSDYYPISYKKNYVTFNPFQEFIYSKLLTKDDVNIVKTERTMGATTILMLYIIETILDKNQPDNILHTGPQPDYIKWFYSNTLEIMQKQNKIKGLSFIQTVISVDFGYSSISFQPINRGYYDLAIIDEVEMPDITYKRLITVETPSRLSVLSKVLDK